MSKKIFLLRHADYKPDKKDPELSEDGKLQADILAEKIKSNLNGNIENVTIWTSSANRAKGTAEIIQKKLQLLREPIEHDKLWSGKGGHGEDFDWLKNELDNFSGEVLVIVSHLEYVHRFPRKLGFGSNEAKYAQGVLIQDGDCVNF